MRPAQRHGAHMDRVALTTHSACASIYGEERAFVPYRTAQYSSTILVLGFPDRVLDLICLSPGVRVFELRAVVDSLTKKAARPNMNSGNADFLG